MSASCPFCHGPLGRDTTTNAYPVHCPHCGNPLPAILEEPDAAEDATGKPSLATFLKSTPPPATPEPTAQAASNASGASPEQRLIAASNKPSPVTEAAQAGVPDPAQPGQIPAAGSPTTLTTADEASDPPRNSVTTSSETMPHMAATGDTAPEKPLPPPAVAVTAPHFSQVTASDSSRTTRVLWLALVLLALILILQVILADRERLAADPGWRPLVLTLCKTFGCSVPDWHQPEAFTMLDRNVRPAPGLPGVLDVTATFRNDARWAQAWPTVLLKLSDVDGHIIGARAIGPDDYLPESSERTLLAPGQSARIAVRAHEPDAGAASFRFEFR